MVGQVFTQIDDRHVVDPHGHFDHCPPDIAVFAVSGTVVRLAHRGANVDRWMDLGGRHRGDTNAK